MSCMFSSPTGSFPKGCLLLRIIGSSEVALEGVLVVFGLITCSYSDSAHGFFSLRT